MPEHPERREMKELDKIEGKDLYEKYCLCEKWLGAVAEPNELMPGNKFLRESLNHRPNNCPYCGEALGERRRVFSVVIRFSSPTGYYGYEERHISLKDFKEALGL